MARTPSLNVLINGDPKGLLAAFALTNTTAMGWAAKMKTANVAALLGIGAAAAGVGVALFRVGREFDEAFDIIRVGTGATGDQLDDLKDSFKDVFATVPDDANTVATAIADVNTRMDITGDELEDVSRKFLQLSRITGTDVSSNIQSVTRLFGDWGVTVDDSTGAMDLLFRASQNTGIGVDRLSDLMVQFGAPMRQFGFSFEESAALLAKFEKEGVNTNLVMSGLRQGLGRVAKAGEEPAEALQRVTEEIQNAGSAGDANRLAMELFGTRAGPDMAAAIREGRFEINDLFESIVNGTDTIDAATADTLSFGESMDILRNKVKVAIEPAATMIFEKAGDALEWVNQNAGWLIPTVAALAGGLATLAVVTKIVNIVMAANPFVLIALLIAGLVVAVIAAYKNFETFRNIVDAVWQGIQDVISFAWENIIKPVFEAISWWVMNVVVPIYQRLWDVIKVVWSAIQRAISFAWNSVIKPVFEAVRGFVTGTLVPVFMRIRDVVGRVFSAVGSFISTAWGVIRPIFNTIRNIVGTVLVGVFNTWRSVVSTVFRVVGTVIRAAWNIARPIFDTMRRIISVVLTGAFNTFRNVIQGVWNGVTGAIRGAWNIVRGIFNNFKDGIESVRSFFSNTADRIKGIFTGISDAIRNAFRGAFDAVKNLWNRTLGGKGFDVPGWIPFVGGNEFRFPTFHQGGFVGGPPGAEVPAILEAGELVLSRAQVRALGFDRNNPTTMPTDPQPVSVVNNFYGSNVSAADITDEIMWQFKVAG